MHKYILVKKSTLCTLAALAALGGLACYMYKKRHGAPENAEQAAANIGKDLDDAAEKGRETAAAVAQKGKTAAKKAAEDLKDEK